MMDLRTLCMKAGLSEDVAIHLDAEELTVHMLLAANLSERREVLRAMGLSYGAIMMLNRVLSRWQQKQKEELGTDEEFSDDVEEFSDDASDDEQAVLDEENIEGDASQLKCSAVVPPTNTGSAPYACLGNQLALEPKLQAAAMLLERADTSTLDVLQVRLLRVNCSL